MDIASMGCTVCGRLESWQSDGSRANEVLGGKGCLINFHDGVAAHDLGLRRSVIRRRNSRWANRARGMPRGRLEHFAIIASGQRWDVCMERAAAANFVLRRLRGTEVQALLSALIGSADLASPTQIAKRRLMRKLPSVEFAKLRRQALSERRRRLGVALSTPAAASDVDSWDALPI